MRFGRWSRGSNRVNRGGSWRNDDPDNFRGANRNRNDPDNRNDNLGFRLVSTVFKARARSCPIHRIRGLAICGDETVGPAAVSKRYAQRRRGACSASQCHCGTCLLCSKGGLA